MKHFTLTDIQSSSKDNSVSSLFENIGEGQSLAVEISYPSEFKSSKIIREFMDTIYKKMGVDTKWIPRLVLIIDELNNNAIEYGSLLDETNILTIQIQNTQNTLDIVMYVADTGNGAHHKTASEMEELRQSHKNKDFSKHDSIRGRGLFLIIERLVDELMFEDTLSGGLRVGFRKKLQKYQGT